jgi:putative ABC transport system substrate-binding protein
VVAWRIGENQEMAALRGVRMRRRDAMLVFGGVALGWPLAVAAQQPSLPIVAFLADGTPEGFAPRVAGVRRGLSDMGFVEGRDVVFEFRWARGNYDLLPDLVSDLVRRNVSVIVTAGTEKVTRAAKDATTTIPIIATVSGDPVRRGLVASVNRPGGNLTVVSLFTSSNNPLVAKRVELLHEVSPRLAKIGWLVDLNILDYDDQLHDLLRAAQVFGFGVKVAQVPRESEMAPAFASLMREGAGAILETGPLFYNNRNQFIALATSASVPVLYEWRTFVDEGGLMSYGSDLAEIFRQAGVYAGRVLKGEKVGELPVVQPSKFQLMINLKTAKALGLTIPPSLLARADEVIE